jgi:chromate transporter
VFAAALTGFMLLRPASAPAGAPASHHLPSARRLVSTVLLWLGIWWIPIAALWAAVGSGHVFVQQAVFFSKAAVVTFGGAYAVLAYIAQEAVHTFGWLQPGEMLDGIGMAETTPGPLIQVVQFVAFLGAFRDHGALHPLAAGIIGSVVTTWVTYAPCFLWVFAAAPYVELVRGRPALAGALAAITAAVVGVILNLSLWFAIHTIFARTATVDVGVASFLVGIPASVRPAPLGLALLSFLLIFGFRWGMLRTLAASAVLGCVLAFGGWSG